MATEPLRAVRRLFLPCFAGGLVIAACNVHAAPYELIYSGTFSTSEALNLASAGSASNFAAPTAFTYHALFDDSTPNLAPTFGGPFNGFRAYAPSSVTINIAGTPFTVDPATAVTVAIFDRASFDPGHYAIGLIVDPVHDGAGIVGDFASASPDYTAAALTPTVFGDFYGVGHASGLCLSGSPPACPHAVTPWLLRDSSNVAHLLTLGSFELDYPIAHTPGAGLTSLETAQILAVPEPASAGLMLGGLVGLSVAMRRKAVAGAARPA